jgi:hypothetical protein
MAVSTPAAVGTGSALALGPTVVAPVIGWAADYSQLQPPPPDAALQGAATIAVFIGGGVAWTVVTLVRHLFRKHHIIEENGSGKAHAG